MSLGRDRYDLFASVSALMEMTEQSNPARCAGDAGVEYLKLVQTGGLTGVHHDYGRGFLVVEIRTIWRSDTGGYHTRLCFATIDDGDFGGWGTPITDLGQALARTKQVADYFREMVTLPTQDEMNEALRPLGLYVGRE